MKTSGIIAGVAVAALSLGLVGCTPSAPDKTTLNVLTLMTADTPEGKIQADVIAAFEKKTGIKVNLTVATDDIPEVYETSTVGGKEADVVISNLAEKSVDWAKNGIVVPVNDYLDDWGLTDKIKPDAIKEWTNADGDISGFPYRGFVWPVWYNMDLLEQAGVDEIPTTTDELIDVAGKLRDAGIAPVVTGGNDWSGQKMFLQIIQSYMTPEQAQTLFAGGNFCGDANAMKGIKLFTKLRDAGVFIDDVEGYSADQMTATFYEGKAAIMSSGDWGFAGTPADLNVKLGGFPVPSGGEYDKPTALSGFTANGFMISDNGVKKIDIVKQFITAFYAPDVAGRFVSEANTSTAVLFDKPVEISNPLLMQATNDLPDSTVFAVMPDAFVPGPVADPMIRQTSVAFAPGTDADAICAALDSVYPQ